MPIRRLLVLALVAGLPGIAKAQFTTFIPPKSSLADSVKAAVVAEQKATTDSVSHAQLTNMKTWVDSAAGLVPTSTAADSLAAGTTAAAESTTFRNGARAPATASDLPLLLLTGAGMLVAGLVTLRSRPREARVRSSRRA